MPPAPPCPAPSRWWQMRASGLLLQWQLQLGAYSVFCFVLFPPSYVALWDPKTPHRPSCERVSCLETPPSSRLPPQVWSPSLTLLSFCLLYFVLPPFKENRLPFWVPGVFLYHSEVVLWKLLSIQMIFWWICGEESGLQSYSSAILGPPPCLFFFFFFFKQNLTLLILVRWPVVFSGLFEECMC